MRLYLIFFSGILSIFLNACGNYPANTIKDERSIEYQRQKAGFNAKFINQFPRELETDSAFASSNLDLSNNNIGLILYEYGVDNKKINAILAKLQKDKFIGKYSANDTCLLIVNPFQKSNDLKTFNEPSLPKYYAKELEKKCNVAKYPIPNFIDYKYSSKNLNIKLEDDFDIYVLEAKPGLYFTQYDLKPDIQMPKNWQNGYSKGIAVNKEKRTVIYWSIVW